MVTHKKVLMLVENLSVPADPRVWREACTLAEHGLQVSIICPKGETKDREAYVCIDTIHIYRYTQPIKTQGALDYLKEYGIALTMTFVLSLKVFFRHGFDVIHAANPPDMFFLIGLFYRLFGKKYIFDQHDLAPEMFLVKYQGKMQWLYKLLRFLEYCSYRTAHIVITTNVSQKNMALTRGKSHPDKVCIVRNGPEVSKYLPAQYDLSLKQGKRFLLAYLGVMGNQDGVDYALYALNELVHKRQQQDVLLVLMGDGDQLPVLKELSHSLHLDGYVHFAGWVQKQEMLRYLTVADICLSPDPSNILNDHSTMLKTMEYMAMGKPVVAFDLPETRFSAQETALYATPNRVEEFVDHIETLLADQHMRECMGAQGRKRIEEDLSWECSKGFLLKAYDRLFSKNAPSEQLSGDSTIPTPTLSGQM